MKKASTYSIKFIKNLLPSLALFLASSSVINACFFWAYQPDVPEELSE